MIIDGRFAAFLLLGIVILLIGFFATLNVWQENKILREKMDIKERRRNYFFCYLLSRVILLFFFAVKLFALSLTFTQREKGFIERELKKSKLL